MPRRETLGTIMLVIVLVPFISYFINAFTTLIQWFDVGQFQGWVEDLPDIFKGVVGLEYTLVSYLYSVLTNPQTIAVLIGIGLIIAAVSGGRD